MWCLKNDETRKAAMGAIGWADPNFSSVFSTLRNSDLARPITPPTFLKTLKYTLGKLSLPLQTEDQLGLSIISDIK